MSIGIDDFRLAISSDTPELVAELLEALDLENDDPEDTNRLLALLIQACHEFNASRIIVVAILERWDENSEITIEGQQLGDDELKTITLCFALPNLDLSDLDYLARTLTAISYSEIVIDLIRHVPGTIGAQAVERATRVFQMEQISEVEELVNLINAAEEYVHPQIHAYLMEIYEELSPDAAIPPWVIPAPADFNFNYYDYTVPSVIINIPPDIEEQIRIILTGYREERPGLFKDTNRDRLPAEQEPEARAQQLRELEPEAREELVKQMLVSLERLKLADDEELNKRLGPANPAVRSFLDDSNETLDRVCRVYGGCRMLLCNCLSNQDPDEEGETDWFTGKCQQCLMKIKHRSHALREPRIHGGWLGCYCSLDCAREYVDDDNIEEASQRRVWLEVTVEGLTLQGIYHPSEDE